MAKMVCPKCGKPKRAWFNLCFECSEKEKKKPTCEVCEIEVPEGHNLCKTHWTEKQEQQKKLKQIDYVKTKKELDFKDKFEGKFYFNGQKLKSKAELILSYFFAANGINAQYETLLDIEGTPYRPDFIICEGESIIIVEHFGGDSEDYNKKRAQKEKDYAKLLKDPHWFFVWTDENDMYNLKDNLGKKLNKTPLKKVMWK